MMQQLVTAFPQQILSAVEISKNSTLSFKEGIQNIVISGLGGSGIGGKLISAIVADTCPLPIVCNNDYHLPTFANHNSLVVICSYSGNTEETVAVMEAALEKECQIICITSGGRVLELAQEHNLQHIIIPGGNPPRSMLAYSLIQLIHVMGALGFAPEGAMDQVEDSAVYLAENQEEIFNAAESIGPHLAGKFPILYSSTLLEPVIVRWRQQLNENSKMLCSHHVIPEMNHNELVGWERGSEEVVVIMLRSELDFTRTAARMDICEKIFNDKSEVIIINGIGKSLIEQFFQLIHLGDWISLVLAEAHEVDAMTIDNINLLKDKLANL